MNAPDGTGTFGPVAAWGGLGGAIRVRWGASMGSFVLIRRGLILVGAARLGVPTQDAPQPALSLVAGRDEVDSTPGASTTGGCCSRRPWPAWGIGIAPRRSVHRSGRHHFLRKMSGRHGVQRYARSIRWCRFGSRLLREQVRSPLRGAWSASARGRSGGRGLFSGWGGQALHTEPVTDSLMAATLQVDHVSRAVESNRLTGQATGCADRYLRC